MIEIRFRNGRSLGKVEEQFAASLRTGDTFLGAGLPAKDVRALYKTWFAPGS